MLQRSQSDVKTYVLFGYKKSDPDETGYLSKDCDTITDDIDEAKHFTSKNVMHIHGFGTPRKWMKFFNDEQIDKHGQDAFVFHLVRHEA